MLDIIADLRFDFEKDYLLDIHQWTQQFTKRGVLLDHYLRSQSDIIEAELLGNEFYAIVGVTGRVKRGLLCGHRGGRPLGAVPWPRNDDGRVWTASTVGIIDEDVHTNFKLKSLLQLEVDTLKRLHNHRKSILKGFEKYESMKKSSSPKNLYKEGNKLDEMLAEYRGILNTEMTLRRRLLMNLLCRVKTIGESHKDLLFIFARQLSKVVNTLCYGSPPNPEENLDAFERLTTAPSRKCQHCRQVDGETKGGNRTVLKGKKKEKKKEGRRQKN